MEASFGDAFPDETGEDGALPWAPEREPPHCCFLTGAVSYREDCAGEREWVPSARGPCCFCLC